MQVCSYYEETQCTCITFSEVEKGQKSSWSVRDQRCFCFSPSIKEIRERAVQWNKGRWFFLLPSIPGYDEWVPISWPVRIRYWYGSYLHGNGLFVLNIYHLETRGKNLQAEWCVCTTLWGALDWDTLQSATFYRCADLVGCVLVRVAVGRGALWPASSSLRKPSPDALTLLGGARLIVWRLTGPEAFLEPPSYLG